MDGAVKKESEASPNGSPLAAGRPGADGAVANVTGQEEQLMRLYMDLTGCSESEARSTYMHVHRAGNVEAGDGD
jgi:hypothetical protein